VVDFADLREARPEAVAPAARAWAAFAAALGELERRVPDELTGPLRRSEWRGPAATAAWHWFDLLDDEFELAAAQVRVLATVVRAAAVEFAALHRNLVAAVDAAVSLGLRVDAAGRVHAPDGPGSLALDAAGQEAHRRAVTNAEIYDELIASIVRRADEADRRYAEAVARFRPGSYGQAPWEYSTFTGAARETLSLFGLAADDIPSGGDPAAARAWWQGLSDEQRLLYLTACPERVGALDGLPATDRDEANRLALRIYIGDNVTHYRDHGNSQHDRAVHLLNTLEASEQGPPAKRLYLLGIDNQGDGKAIVAVGNPDTARHTAVLVPGVGTELDDIRGQIARADRLQSVADAHTAGVDGDVAVIAWLGYDTPGTDDDILTAPFGGKSRDGAAALDQFVNGLNAAHGPGPSHVTAIGHSYGSTVIGVAASTGDGLAVTDIVTAGSPGMRVDQASDLRVADGHVWAGAAGDDHIANPNRHMLASGLLIGPWAPYVEDELVHGPSPHYRDFGANRFHVDTSGHSGYWDEGSESLDNQAAIIVGQYGRVGLDHGKQFS